MQFINRIVLGEETKIADYHGKMRLIVAGTWMGYSELDSGVLYAAQLYKIHLRRNEDDSFNAVTAKLIPTDSTDEAIQEAVDDMLSLVEHRLGLPFCSCTSSAGTVGTASEVFDSLLEPIELAKVIDG